MDTGTPILARADIEDMLDKLGYDKGTSEFEKQVHRRFVSAATLGGPAEMYVDNPDLILNEEDQARIDAMRRNQRYVGRPSGPLPGQSGEELYGRGWDPETMTASG